MQEAITVRGESYEFAEQFLENVKSSGTGQVAETPEERRKRITDHYERVGGVIGAVAGIYGSKLLPISNFVVTVVSAIVVGALGTWLAWAITKSVLDSQER